MLIANATMAVKEQYRDKVYIRSLRELTNEWFSLDHVTAKRKLSECDTFFVVFILSVAMLSLILVLL